MATNIAKIRIRQDTTANWNTYNPILALGEWALEMLPNGELKTKLGDGSSAWDILPYFAAGSGSGFSNLSYEEEGAPLRPFASLAQAIQSVQLADRALAAGILFCNTGGEWEIYTYIGSDVVDGIWNNTDNWKQIAENIPGLKEASHYFNNPLTSGLKTYYLDASSDQTLEYGSREYPFKTLNALLVEMGNAPGVIMVGESSLPSIIPSSVPDGTIFVSYGSSRRTAQVDRIESLWVQFEGLSFTKSAIEVVSTNVTFTNCFFKEGSVFTLNPTQTSTRCYFYRSNIGKFTCTANSQIVNIYAYCSTFTAYSSPVVICSGSGLNIALLDCLVLTRADSQSFPGVGGVQLSSVDTCSLTNTLCNRVLSTITASSLKVDGLAAEQVVDRGTNRFTAITPASITQRDINTAFDTALTRLTPRVYSGTSGVYYLDYSTTEDSTYRTGQREHPWKTFAEAYASLSANDILHVVYNNSSDVFMVPESAGNVTIIAERPDAQIMVFENTSVSTRLIGFYISEMHVGIIPGASLWVENCTIGHMYYGGTLDSEEDTLIFENCIFPNQIDIVRGTFNIRNSRFFRILNVIKGVVTLDNVHLTLQQSGGKVILRGECSLKPDENLSGGAFDAVITGGSVYFDTYGVRMFEGTGAPYGLPALSITNANTEYSLGRFVYDVANSVIDLECTELAYPLQAGQIKDANNSWALIQPETAKQSDINKALDASLALLNRAGANRGEVLSAYEPSTAWGVTGVSVASGTVYSVNAVQVNVSGTGYVTGDKVTSGHGTVYEVEANQVNKISNLGLRDRGYSSTDFAGTGISLVPEWVNSASGTGATVDITTKQGYYTSGYNVQSGGTGYEGGDRLTASGDIQDLIIEVQQLPGLIGPVTLYSVIQHLITTTTQPAGTVLNLQTLTGGGSGAVFLTTGDVQVYCVDTYILADPGAGYSISDKVKVDIQGAPLFEVLSTHNDVLRLDILDPGLSLTNFAGGGLSTTALTGNGTGLLVNISTISGTLLPPVNYKVGDVVLLRAPSAVTIASAHFVVTAVDGTGAPTSFDISAPGAYLQDIADILPTGTSGQGEDLVVLITDAETSGDTLRKFLMPPDGTATASTKAKPGDVVRVLRDENFGGVTRNYIYSDFNGDGTYNFVPQSGAPAGGNYVGDELFVHITSDRIVTLLPRIQVKIAAAVQNIGDEIINGQKTFTVSPPVPAKTTDPLETNVSVLATEAQVAKIVNVIDGGEWL